MRHAAIVAALLFAGCGRMPTAMAETASPQKAEPVHDQALSKNDLWDRRRQCAAQAVAVANRPEFTRISDSGRPTGWSNHYNAALDRCYVRFNSFITHEKGDAEGIPKFTYSVIDAFDDRGPATMCTDERNAADIFCSVRGADGEERFGVCGECRSLSKRLMSD